MNKSEYIRDLINSLPDGAVVRVSDMGTRLAESIGCAPEDVGSTVRQVVMRMEHQGQVVRAFRGVYVKSSGRLDVSDDAVLKTIAYQLYVDRGTGYYRGLKALDSFGLHAISKDCTIRIATNASTGRQTSMAKRLGVMIEKPTTTVDPENARYLETLDMVSENLEALMELDDASIRKLFARIEKDGLDFKKLMGYASKYGSVRAVKAVAKLCERLL